MRRIPQAVALLLLCAAAQAFAQTPKPTPKGPRDLFNTYKEAGPVAPAQGQGAANNNVVMTGRPGVRVRIELLRGGRARWVSPRTTFQAGDRVRFHFNMNFPGYVVIINTGSSGARTMLFPYEGVSNRVGLTADYTVPQGQAWFEFDNTPGEEQLTFIMSKREIQEVTQLNVGNVHVSTQATTAAGPGAPTSSAPASPPSAPAPQPANTAPTSAPAPNSTPGNADGGGAATAQAPQTEEQEILAALNSRALSGGRDLKVVEENNDGYVLATEDALARPVGFRLTLKHR
ncbi:MAG: DUF4384 domain-containing protein [Pyrinomonadaceae bacterium]